MTAKATLAQRQAPRSMLLLRRAADAAGYAVAGAPDEAPAVSRYRAPAPALFVASLFCVVGIALAIY